MGLVKAVENFENAPWPVKYGVKTALTIPLYLLNRVKPVISLLPERAFGLLETEDALRDTKKTSLLEFAVGAADIGYGFVTGDRFLPGLSDTPVGFLGLSDYLVADGIWRYQRASFGWQNYRDEFSFFRARKLAARGTAALEVGVAVVKRLWD